MLFHVNPSSGVPIYAQVETQIKNAIAAGALKSGQPLPSVRKLAAELGINPNTAARAYQELEREGTITTVPGGGTFVAGGQPRFLKSERIRRLQPYARQIAVEGTQLGLNETEILDLVQEEARKAGGTSMMQPAISTDFLTKIYGQVSAVRELNLNVPRGAIYGFLGRNGAGKTTTIKMLLGLARPTSGSARVLGMNTETDRIAIFQRTAFVSEKKTLYPLLTPKELVRFSRGFYPTWDDAAAEKYSHLLEIPMTQRFDKLSNGNQTKVFLLLALAQGADLLILDEPTTALDPLTADEFLRVLAASAMERGCTVFFSSHQLEEVERIAEYVGVMDHGKLMLESRLDDIKSEFRLIIAVGNSLPRQTSPQVLSVTSEGNCCRYFVTQDADGFAAKLTQNGGTVTQVVSLGLREIFLQLVRKELPCTSGNAGATLVGSSSFS